MGISKTQMLNDKCSDRETNQKHPAYSGSMLEGAPTPTARLGWLGWSTCTLGCWADHL